MPQPDLISVDIAKITSFNTVLTELRTLDTQLSPSKLSQFIVFNKAYSVVTNAIKEAAEDNYFENPIFIEKFTVCFAQFYFLAINDTVAEKPELTVAWAKMNDAKRRSSTPAFILLLMGANAHINHDLSLALVKLMDKEKTDDLLQDVLKIDKLLMKSGRQIITTFNEPNRSLDVIKRRLQFLYYRPTMYMILYWRVKAWRDYKAIRNVGAEKASYKARSIKIANRLSKLGVYLSQL
jgi:hypothetical protein